MNREYIEEANRDAVMIAAAKLVAYDVVSKVKIVFVRLESCVVWWVGVCYPSI